MKNEVVIFDKEMDIFDETYEVPEQKNSEPHVDEQGKTYYYVRINDRSIYRKANVRVYIPSNELSNHNEPHVHVVIDREYEFVVNIRNIEIIIEPKKSKPKLKSSVIHLTKNEIQLFRKEWNNSSTLLKFVKNTEGHFTEEVYKN